MQFSGSLSKAIPSYLDRSIAPAVVFLFFLLARSKVLKRSSPNCSVFSSVPAPSEHKCFAFAGACVEVNSRTATSTLVLSMTISIFTGSGMIFHFPFSRKSYPTDLLRSGNLVKLRKARPFAFSSTLDQLVPSRAFPISAKAFFKGIVADVDRASLLLIIICQTRASAREKKGD